MKRLFSFLLAAVFLFNIAGANQDLLLVIDQRIAEIDKLVQQLTEAEEGIISLQNEIAAAEEKPFYRIGRTVGITLTVAGIVTTAWLIYDACRYHSPQDVVFERPDTSSLGWYFFKLLSKPGAIIVGGTLWVWSTRDVAKLKAQLHAAKKLLKKLNKQILKERAELIELQEKM